MNEGIFKVWNMIYWLIGSPKISIKWDLNIIWRIKYYWRSWEKCHKCIRSFSHCKTGSAIEDKDIYICPRCNQNESTIMKNREKS